MQFDRYEIASERKRLWGQLQLRGTEAGSSAWGFFLFGVPFIAVGLWVIWIGLNQTSSAPSQTPASHWILVVFGTVFALSGGMLWGLGWGQIKANRRRRELALRDPARADYPWEEKGFTPPRWSRLTRSVGGLILMALFLSLFNWWAFFDDGPWPVKIITGIFDLILVFGVGQMGILISRILKFGPSRIEFARFPYRPGEPVSLYWRVPRGVTRATAGTFTLRCVTEWYETHGTGKQQRRIPVREHLWSVTGHLEQPREILPGKMETLHFDIPADAAGTSFHHPKAKAVFWELVVHLDLAGLDFRETYLVPVYRPPGGGGLEPAPIQLNS
mgnify:CR=1 FL=1